MPWRVLFGSILLLLLAGFIVDQADIAADFNFSKALVFYAPLIIVAIGLNQLVRAPGQPLGALVVIGVGLWMMVEITAGGKVDHLVILSSIAVMMVALRITLPGAVKRDRTASAAGARGPKVPVRFAHEMRDTIVFAGSHFKNDSQRFQGGRVVAVVGDYDIDLRGAMLQQTGADLHISAVFGTVRIRIPESMGVTVAGTPIFANIDHHTEQFIGADHGRPMLRIKAVAVAGTVEVMN
jgi:predicted membrane protein